MNIQNRNKKTNMLFAKTYGLWKNMMNRCTNKKHPQYINYGAKGVTICDKWKTYDGFIDDIDSIKGFDLLRYMSGELELDKDGCNMNGKIYDLSSCEFISSKLNKQRKPNQQKEFMAISPNGVQYKSFNQSKFAKEHDLRQSSINDCLSGKCKTHKKWTFYYL